jgi:cobalt/nickel transport system permease protein
MDPGVLGRLRELDRLAARPTPLRRLDNRVKVLYAGAFILTVVSSPKYDLPALAPYLLFLLLSAGIAGLSPLWLLRRSLPAAWVALLLGAFHPLLDRRPWSLGGLTVAAGWISLAVLLAKALLSAGMAVVLLASASFTGFSEALARLGAPRLFTTQLLLLWRYAAVLAEEASRLVRARDLRDPQRRARGPRATARLIGVLLRRALERSERIHAAMLSRGFNGRFPAPTPPAVPAPVYWGLAAAIALLLACRLLPLHEFLGSAVLRLRP